MALSRTLRSLEGAQFEIWTQKVQLEQLFCIFFNLKNKKMGLRPFWSVGQGRSPGLFFRWPYVTTPAHSYISILACHISTYSAISSAYDYRLFICVGLPMVVPYISWMIILILFLDARKLL